MSDSQTAALAPLSYTPALGFLMGGLTLSFKLTLTSWPQVWDYHVPCSWLFSKGLEAPSMHSGIHKWFHEHLIYQADKSTYDLEF